MAKTEANVPDQQISSVLGVEQNESISRLTWLTIIYLGPGLLTVCNPASCLSPKNTDARQGIFGMGHNVVPERMELKEFMWILSVMVIGTIIFAALLRLIIKGIKAIGEPIVHFLKDVWYFLRDLVAPIWRRVHVSSGEKRQKASDVEVAVGKAAGR